MSERTMTRSSLSSHTTSWRRLFAAGCWLLLSAPLLCSQTTLVSVGSTWSFLDDGVDPGLSWTALAFDDSSWSAGPAPLGYGGDGPLTAVDFGPDSANKFTTTWFRHEFNVANPASFDFALLRLRRDDGAVAYLNGTEIFRSNLPTGTINSSTFSSSTVSAAEEYSFYSQEVDPALLLVGNNVLAVEVHQRSLSSSDLSFDAALFADDKELITRGPYLQLKTSSSVIVRWRSHVDTLGRVAWGTSPGNLTNFADDALLAKKHAITISGLPPSSTWFYSVGTPTDVLAGDDPVHTFTTAPVPGTNQPVRIWAIGDSGEADANADAVRDAYLTYTGATATDVWLMLGDNAYDDGTTAQYQAAVFDRYPTMLAQTGPWPTRGNHDKNLSIFHDLFDFPTAGEAGGLPSGTEAYYSFDYANIHFLCLDSEGSSKATNGPMWTWADADLAATDQEWIIAYWHHPPYTKGSHDSDNESDLVAMRVFFLPMLEDHGVDLVLNGHSHSYERSSLIDGHYGLSTTFDPSMVIDGGDGNPTGDGAYNKGVGPHEGTVYCVAGSSSKLSSGPLDHPAMVVASMILGSLVIDVDDDELRVTFLDDSGAVFDDLLMRHYDAWNDLGNGLAGTTGVPLLDGRGPLLGDTFVALDLSGALPSAGATLVAGLSALNLPFKGGVLVPSPDVLFVGLVTDGLGDIHLVGSWPPGIPPGVSSIFQYWIGDPGATVSFSASNGVAAVAQ
ncbi:MAG: hypothetical protein ACI9EF_001342 [Pseudohongiellaceae bacterium]|jgi:hypothetical protein